MRLPTSTYRLQFNSTFGFADAMEVMPYLSNLGISDVYASPIFKAVKGSTHGYDVTDPMQINPEIGTEEELEELSRLASELGLGWVQDTVPNHMAYSDQNPLLSDLLENGSRSEYRNFFDINWAHPEDDSDRRLLAPFLLDHYSKCLENGDIGLTFSSDGFKVNYSQASFPLSLESYAMLLSDYPEASMGADGHIRDSAQGRVSLSALNRALDYDQCKPSEMILDLVPDLTQLSKRDAHVQAARIKRDLWKSYSRRPDVKELIDHNLAMFRGRKDDPGSFDLLDELLSMQNFKLAFFEAGRDEINYRRFFTINDLISMRMEDENAFNTGHALAFDLIDRGIVTGVRIDHIDGLLDPEEYIKRLRSRIEDCYIVVEKILARGEGLQRSWQVQGTTGYDFLNMACGLFCDQRRSSDFDRIRLDFAGKAQPFDEMVRHKKMMIIERQMNGDIDNLTTLLRRIAAENRYGRDATFLRLRRSIVEALSSFKVYRTYVSSRGAASTDRRHIGDAIAAARTRCPQLEFELGFLHRVLTLDLPAFSTDEERTRWVEFAMRFQQFSSPLMAKGFEDTALYVYSRLISLNNVGGSPELFGVSVDEFHRFCQERARLWPHTMNATSTHDTKRGEDASARINVLSEMPDLWKTKVAGWAGMNLGKKRQVQGKEVPDGNEEYFLYQTLVGALPFTGIDKEFCDRVKEYMVKSLREGKVHSRWSRPNADYEKAFTSFVEDILRPGKDSEFLKDLTEFCALVSHCGIFNTLSQVLIKISAPGIPDFYQGTEMWDLSFVDPDNRRTVDFEERKNALDEIIKRGSEDLTGLAENLISSMEDGRIKLFLIHRALMARKAMSELFSLGSYLPLGIEGKNNEHCVAYARVYGGRWAVTVAPRLMAGLVSPDEAPLGRDVWGDTRVTLPGGAPDRWTDLILQRSREGDGELFLGEILGEFPVALLQGQVE